MQIDLNPEAMRDLLTKTLFDSMGEEERGRILKAAIVELLTPAKKDPYSSKPPLSPLEEAMRNAAYTVANTIARERLATDPEFQANLEGLFADVAKKLFASEVREKLVTTICDAVVSGLNAR